MEGIITEAKVISASNSILWSKTNSKIKNNSVQNSIFKIVGLCGSEI